MLAVHCRPVFLVATAALTAAAMALAACANLRVLWLVAPLCGFAYGRAIADHRGCLSTCHMCVGSGCVLGGTQGIIARVISPGVVAWGEPSVSLHMCMHS